MPGSPAGTLNQVGFQELAVSGVAVGLTRPTGARPRHAYIGVSGGAVRWLAIHGDAPSSTRGAYVGAGGSIDWTSMENDYAGLIDNVKFIKAGPNDASLEVTFFG